MYAVMNGETPPPPLPKSAPPSKSVLEPVDVDSFLQLSDISESGEKENNGSFVSAKSALSTYSSASTVNAMDIPLPVTNGMDKVVSTKTLEVNSNSSDEDGDSKAKSRKRRSLTEISELNPMSHQNKTVVKGGGKKNIYFETDL